jgi:hypothetical protein
VLDGDQNLTTDRGSEMVETLAKLSRMKVQKMVLKTVELTCLCTLVVGEQGERSRRKWPLVV